MSFPSLSQYQSAQQSAGTPSVTYENPAFKVHKASTDPQTQQQGAPGRSPVNNDAADKFAIGDMIVGRDYQNDEAYEGQIISIIKNNQGDGMVLVILDKEEVKRKIDATTASKKRPPVDRQQTSP